MDISGKSQPLNHRVLLGGNGFYNPRDYAVDPGTSVFVFGSNLAGRHGKGAALTALRKHQAVYGIAEGLQGYAYGIPTKDEALNILPLEFIKQAVERFIAFTYTSPLPCVVTAVGTGLAGYKHIQIAPMFRGARNCWFPIEWYDYLSANAVPKLNLPDNK